MHFNNTILSETTQTHIWHGFSDMENYISDNRKIEKEKMIL